MSTAINNTTTDMEYASNIMRIPFDINRIMENYGYIPCVVVTSHRNLVPIIHTMVTLESAENRWSGLITSPYLKPETGLPTVYLDVKGASQEFGYDTVILNRLYDLVVTVDRETSEATYSINVNKYHQMFPFPSHSLRWAFAIITIPRIAYRVINKCASTYITRHLFQLEKDAEHKDMFFREGSALKAGCFFPKKSPYFRFTVVRNPYSRLVSCYRDIIDGQNPTPDARRIFLRKCCGLPTDVPIAFDTFVDHLEKTGFKWTLQAEHWLPQSMLVAQDCLNYDIMGKMESLHAFLNNYIKPTYDKCNIEYPFNPDDEKLRTSSTPNSAPWQEYYTTKLRKRVYEMYKSDFKNFDYSYSLS